MPPLSKAVRQATKRPLILISADPAVMAAGLAAWPAKRPLICGADATNWEAMAELAKQRQGAAGRQRRHPG